MRAKFEPGMTLSATFNENAAPGGASYLFGAGLSYDPETRTVSVDTAETVTAGDTRPVTSAAVAVELGNVEALLHII